MPYESVLPSQVQPVSRSNDVAPSRRRLTRNHAMKFLTVRPHLGLLAAVAFAGALSAPAQAAELKILEPADRSLVKGTVQIRIKPIHDGTEQYFSDPDVILQDEYGRQLQKVIAILDAKTGICTVPLDTRKLKDGVCLVTVKYRTLFQGRVPREAREDLTLSVRNGAARPAKFVVEVPAKDVASDESGDVTVRVYDQKGKLMPGARVTFKVDRGELDTSAEITDSTGEALASIDTEAAEMVTVTITVEGLPPVTKTLKFIE